MSNRPARELLAECIEESGLSTWRVATELHCSAAALTSILDGTLNPGYRMRCAIKRWTRGRIDLPAWDTPKEREQIEKVVPNPKIRRRPRLAATGTDGDR